MRTSYQRTLFFDSHTLMIELRQIKGKRGTHQTKRFSIFQKASHIFFNVVETNSSTKLNSLQVYMPTM